MSRQLASEVVVDPMNPGDTLAIWAAARDVIYHQRLQPKGNSLNGAWLDAV